MKKGCEPIRSVSFEEFMPKVRRFPGIVMYEETNLTDIRQESFEVVERGGKYYKRASTRDEDFTELIEPCEDSPLMSKERLLEILDGGSCNQKEAFVVGKVFNRFFGRSKNRDHLILDGVCISVPDNLNVVFGKHHLPTEELEASHDVVWSTGAPSESDA
ncbi:MAG: hypothetical protein L6Q31_05895 [Fimbriimonadaceae bacterium]|nr:hypothetical protein [Fimbriimonadaceae bacterium]NUM38605.1 hypothetical protein [Armatimonadota bacterium]